MSDEEPTRRERYRQRTVVEIKAVAMAQVQQGGAESLSLNAIARSMAMSAPALYRYFDSRDELLAELAVDIHHTLADALTSAAAREASAASQVLAVANAYRDWALAHPNAYRLAYESAHGSGLDHATDRIAPAAQRGMNVLLGVVAQAGEPPAVAIPPRLEEQLRRWNGDGSQHPIPTNMLHFGLVWWCRLHGLISLELGRHLTATGVDTALFYRAEIETMLDSLRHHQATTT